MLNFSFIFNLLTDKLCFKKKNIILSIFQQTKLLKIKKLIKLLNYIFLILFFNSFFSKTVFCEIKNFNISLNDINDIVNNEVRESFSYSGLASYYNKVETYIISNKKIERIENDNFYNLNSIQTLAIVGHHKILIINNLNISVLFKKGKIIFQEINSKKKKLNENNVDAKILLKSDLNYLEDKFQKLKYVYLWEPFRLLCIFIERNFILLNSTHNFGWGVTIILLSLIFKILIFPLNILLIHSQRKVSNIQALLSSELKDIKLNFSGEEAHNKFLSAHKAKGVTPYYNLRPLFFTLFPIPFFITIFNVLGEIDLIVGHSFLWIKDLAYPDAIFHFGLNLPLLGNSINLLPILMTIISIFGSVALQKKTIGVKESSIKKFNIYLISFSFLILFYSFPSAMVLFWTFNSIWHVILQSFFKI